MIANICNPCGVAGVSGPVGTTSPARVAQGVHEIERSACLLLASVVLLKGDTEVISENPQTPKQESRSECMTPEMVKKIGLLLSTQFESNFLVRENVFSAVAASVATVVVVSGLIPQSQ